MKQGMIVRQRLASVLLVALFAMTGCDGFFVPEPGHGGGTTGNNVYVANGLTNTVAGFSISSGKLTGVSGSPLAVGYSPQALVVTPSNSFLYVAGPGAIYLYTINSNGSLSVSSSGSAVASANTGSLAISPDGQWLFGLDLTATVLDQFKINTTTGALTAETPTPYTIQNAAAGTAPSPRMVRVAATGNYIFAAVGNGDVVFTLNTTTGAVAQVQSLALASAQTSDNALAVDSTTAHLYIARSGLNGGLAVYTIGASGVLTEISGSPFATGAQPFAVQIDNSGKYVYVANRSDGTITGFSIGTNASLSAITGSPYVSGTGVISLGAEKTSTYILAGAFGGQPDLSMYSIDTVNPGKLIQSTTTTTGTDPTGVVEIATTH